MYEAVSTIPEFGIRFVTKQRDFCCNFNDIAAEVFFLFSVAKERRKKYGIVDSAIVACIGICDAG